MRYLVYVTPMIEKEKIHKDLKEEDSDALDELLGLTEEDVIIIQKALENNNFVTVQNLVGKLHPADMADLYEKLSSHMRENLLDTLGDELNGEILSHLDDTLRDDVLETMRPKPLAKLLEDLESDDAIGLLEDLGEDKQKFVLRYVSRSDRALYEEVLSYAHGTAARIMRRELVSIPEMWTVEHVINMLGQNSKDLPEKFQSVVVLGRGHKPLGILALSVLLRSVRESPVKSLLQEDDFYAIPADMPQEDVAYLFQQYDLIEAPVIDEDGRLIGIITIDDIVDIIEEEAGDDILKLGGVREGDFHEDVLDTARLRFPWLVINLGTAILASIVIAFYADSVREIVALAVLMPIVASMGGNAGTQTLTVAVRALATNDLTSTNALRIIWKESLVGGLNGLLFAIIIGGAVWFWFDDVVLGMTIAVAMVLNLLVAGIAGILVPLTLDKFDLDPAISSTVFLTTITDVLGFFVFLGLATMLLL